MFVVLPTGRRSSLVRFAAGCVTCIAVSQLAADEPLGRGGRDAKIAVTPSIPPAAKAPFDAAQTRRHQTDWAEYLGTKVEAENALGMRLVLIPPGAFQMGCPDAYLESTLQWADRVRQSSPGTERRRVMNEERPQHLVVLTKPYWLGKTEITIGQYKRFVDATGYVTETERFGGGNSAIENESAAQKRTAIWNAPGYTVTVQSPVTQITWNDTVRFCNWLSELEGLPAAYRNDAKGNWVLHAEVAGYRLPTEAEWEYACRAGTTTQFSFGDDLTLLDRYAWYDKNADQLGAGAVGSKLPNPFGLFDMHGNVWERCHDWFDPAGYAPGAQRDPLGPAEGERRVVRGGAWHYFDLHCRSSYRNHYSPIGRTGNSGFRIAGTAATPTKRGG